MTGCHDDRERALAIAWHLKRELKPTLYIPRNRRNKKYNPLSKVRDYGRIK